MINFNCSIRNPWAKQTHEILWCRAIPVFKNKSIELGLYRGPTIISIGLDISHRQDHAGVNFEITLFGYNFEFNFYDRRHWNHETNKYDE